MPLSSTPAQHERVTSCGTEWNSSKHVFTFYFLSYLFFITVISRRALATAEWPLSRVQPAFYCLSRNLRQKFLLTRKNYLYKLQNFLPQFRQFFNGIRWVVYRSLAGTTDNFSRSVGRNVVINMACILHIVKGLPKNALHTNQTHFRISEVSD